MTQKTKYSIAALLVLFGVLMRFVPHLWNFTPVVAIALFAGVYLGRKYAIIVPLLTMLISDVFLGFYEGGMMLAVYGSFAVIGIIGYTIRKHTSTATVLGASIFSSLLFFLVTNWAVWQFTPWYPATLDGLLLSYTLAIPFSKNALMGDILYTAGLFGAYEYARYIIALRARKKRVRFTHETA